ncbi:MAG: Arylsulfatase, partial [Verrucomicrobiota bacterium]
RDHKGSIYEGGVRSAAFACWPGRIPAGVRIREPMHMVDWYPTLIKLGGGSLEQKLPIDGLDVWPTITQGAPTPHDAILSVSTQGPALAAVRMGEWKLIEAAVAAEGKNGQAAPKGKNAKSSGKYESIALYHLTADPGETKNLAAEQPERVKAMRTRLADLLKGAVPPGTTATKK